MPELEQAIELYRKFGFSELSQPLGHAKHSACSIRMIKQMESELMS